jgi:nicotinamidase-related amidase
MLHRGLRSLRPPLRALQRTRGSPAAGLHSTAAVRTGGELALVAAAALSVGGAAGWAAASRFHSLEAQLQRRAERAEELAADAARTAAGDASITCTGAREFPVKLSDTALYVTDMQGDFLLPEGRVGQFYSAEDLARMQPVIENCHRLVTAARAAGITIAYGRSHRFGAEVRRDLICPADSDDTYNVIEQLRPRPEDIVVDKWTWGIFASTDLEEQLRARGIRRLIVCGVATNVCVTNMVFQAVDRFFRKSRSSSVAQMAGR